MLEKKYMKKLLNKIRYFFSEEYRLNNHPIYIRLCFHKLYKEWFKCRKLFIKPRLVFYSGDTAEREFDYYMDLVADYKSFENKLFGFHIEGLGWKRKWGYLTFTHCPEIVCVINKKVRFTIRLESPIIKNSAIANRLYWEAILHYVYDKRRYLGKINSKYYLTLDNNSDSSKYYYIDSSLVPGIKDKVICLTPQTED